MMEKTSTIKEWAKEHKRMIMTKPSEAAVAFKNTKRILSQGPPSTRENAEFKYVMFLTPNM